MPLISLDQFAGKTLYAKKNVPIIVDPFGTKKQITTIESGNPIGEIYSWVRKAPGEPLYFLFYTPAPHNKPYYVEYKDGRFNLELLREQGVKTVEEERKEKEEAAKGTGEKIFDFVKKYAIIAGLAYGAILIFKNYKGSNK